LAVEILIMPTVKKAFLFPGHSVRLGMGHSEAKLPDASVLLYSKAEKILGYDLAGLMRHGPLAQLRRTIHSQPAVYLASLAPFYDLAALGVFPDALAGRSLGDFTAVVASGALSFEEGLAIIKLRAEIFERACRRNPGRMAVLLGLPEEIMRHICAEAINDTRGVCEIAGINTDRNFVVSGTFDAVNAAERKAKESGAHVMDIAMPGAFHSSLMREAELEFSEVLDKVEFLEPCVPIVDERSEGGFVGGRDGLRKFLTAQISTGVNWKQRTEIMRSMGAAVLCELGPSQGMARIASGSIPNSSFYEVESHDDAVVFAGALAV
jgi:[acyl-carrier-protein] S-malonyltransferase